MQYTYYIFDFMKIYVLTFDVCTFNTVPVSGIKLYVFGALKKPFSKFFVLI